MLTHPPIGINGAVFQDVLELSMVSQSYVKISDGFFTTPSKPVFRAPIWGWVEQILPLSHGVFPAPLTSSILC